MREQQLIRHHQPCGGREERLRPADRAPAANPHRRHSRGSSPHALVKLWGKVRARVFVHAACTIPQLHTPLVHVFAWAPANHTTDARPCCTPRSRSHSRFASPCKRGSVSCSQVLLSPGEEASPTLERRPSSPFVQDLCAPPRSKSNLRGATGPISPFSGPLGGANAAALPAVLQGGLQPGVLHTRPKPRVSISMEGGAPQVGPEAAAARSFQPDLTGLSPRNSGCASPRWVPWDGGPVHPKRLPARCTLQPPSPWHHAFGAQ